MRFVHVAVALAVLTFASQAPADTLEQQTRHAPLGDTRVVDTWLAAHQRARTSQLTDAYGTLCEIQARAGHYRAAADACARVMELQGRGVSDGARRSLTFWRALSEQPSISVHGEVDTPLTFGWTGMAEAAVTVDGVAGSWGIDTGAEISTMSASDAVRYRVRMLAGVVEVQGSTPGTVRGRLGMVGQLRIGSARIDNVPVLVLPDAALTFGTQRVPALLGAPALYAFGHI